MKKVLVLLMVFLSTISTAFAAKLPDDVQLMLKKTFPNVDIRFDGVIILPDGTVYLPLYPSKMVNYDKLAVQTTYPDKTPLVKCPDVVKSPGPIIQIIGLPFSSSAII